TGGRVVVAGPVGSERIKTNRRVVAAGCVAVERIKTDCRVASALRGVEVEKRAITLGSILVWVTAIGRRINGLCSWRKGKQGQDERNEKKRNRPAVAGRTVRRICRA